MTIAITGATGHLGRLIIPKLAAKVGASNIVALARSVEKAADLGVAAREADYARPETLDSALKGVDTLMLISSSEFGHRAVHHQNIIDAVKRNGVKWIVYTSILRADTSKLDLATEHAATETMLKASGIPFTLLRNGWYTENYTGSIGGALAGGAFIGSAKDGRISSAARADFADAAVSVLTSEGHIGQTYELAGDDSWTLTDLAAEISRQSGKTIPYTDMPAADYAKALEGFGLPGWFATTIAGWDVEVVGGALHSTDRTLSKLIGRPTTPLSASVSEALAAIETAV
ncbi:MAG: SDR family oxidoreductase [Gemmatimonadaceae bacterium]